VRFTFASSGSGTAAPITIRGLLSGQEGGIFGAQTDTSNTVTGQFTAQ
jgi:hypothetical protein